MDTVHSGTSLDLGRILCGNIGNVNHSTSISTNTPVFVRTSWSSRCCSGHAQQQAPKGHPFPILQWGVDSFQEQQTSALNAAPPAQRQLLEPHPRLCSPPVACFPWPQRPALLGVLFDCEQCLIPKCTSPLSVNSHVCAEASSSTEAESWASGQPSNYNQRWLSHPSRDSRFSLCAQG